MKGSQSVYCYPSPLILPTYSTFDLPTRWNSRRYFIFRLALPPLLQSGEVGIIQGDSSMYTWTDRRRIGFFSYHRTWYNAYNELKSYLAVTAYVNSVQNGSHCNVDTFYAILSSENLECFVYIAYLRHMHIANIWVASINSIYPYHHAPLPFLPSILQGLQSSS